MVVSYENRGPISKRAPDLQEMLDSDPHPAYSEELDISKVGSQPGSIRQSLL